MGRTYRVPTDGLTLVAETFGKGKPLVFSHGLMNNRQQGRLLLQPLMAQFRIVGFDQRGQGDSTPVTDPALYDPQRMAADIGAVMDALGIERAVVSGESMGSATALLFALRWPERVEKLLLVAPAFGDAPNEGSAYIKALGRQLSTPEGVEEYIAVAIEGEWQESGFSPDTMAELAAYFRSHQPASLNAACQAVADWVILDSLDRLRALPCPTYIVAWDQDPIHPVTLAQAMVARLPTARMTVVPSPNAIFNDMALVGRTFAEFL
jgi:pimeloyl-ACP methyl ester carboxylesterase